MWSTLTFSIPTNFCRYLMKTVSFLVRERASKRFRKSFSEGKSLPPERSRFLSSLPL